MFSIRSRSGSPLQGIRRSTSAVLLGAACVVSAVHANAVVVRGTVRDPLGRAIPAAHVQLVQGTQVVASGVSIQDGTFEIRSTTQGRFLLIAAGLGFAPQVSAPFFGRTFDVVTQNMDLTITPVHEDVTVTATGIPTPVQQASASVFLIPSADLNTRAMMQDELRFEPGVNVVQAGQYGSQSSLFVRGGNSDANLVEIDGVPANDIGGIFDFGVVSSTAVSGLEVHRGPDSVLYGEDALASVVRFDTPRGASLHPVLNYSGDAGNFHSYRNAADLSGTRGRLDYFGAFSRFNSGNALPHDEFHDVTSAANVGYSFNGNTSLRGTVHNLTSAEGVPGPFEFQGLSANGKQADQDIFFTGTLEATRFQSWHNILSYIGARKREQAYQFASVGTPDGYGDYIGNPVTIHGANGTVASGQVYTGYDPFPTRYDLVSNRDGLDYRTDYRFSQYATALFGFRYQDERGSYRYPVFGENESVGRSSFLYTLQFQGAIKHRIFYTAGGAIERNSLYGTQGTPQFGIAGYAVRPRAGWLHGTRLRFNFAKGVEEPSLAAQLSSLYVELQSAGLSSNAASFGVSPMTAEQSRSYEGGIDQNIYGERAVLHFDYFHNQFGREVEYVTASLYNQYFGQNLPKALYGFYDNSLSFRAQGVESELDYNISRKWLARAGYTFLDATVERSLSGDALAALGGTAMVNPAYPGVAIGVSSPLVGQRPFRRPPQQGFAVVQYTNRRLSAAMKGEFVSRADDSTFIDAYSTPSFDNSMLLPNRNLDHSYQLLDADVRFQLRPSVGVYVQTDNLLNEQHMAPIGYPSLPFTFRAGMSFRIARKANQ